MARNNFMLSKAMSLLCLLGMVLTQAQPQPWSLSQVPKELASKLTRNPQTLSQASTDYGHIVHETPYAVFEPSSVSDISDLIKFSNSLPTPFPIAARGQAHSLHGQAMTRDGVVLNMTQLNGFRNGSGIIIMSSQLGNYYYADVGGEQLWIDVLHATLQRGLTPLSWTDYLYLTVGGTLSNAGISGQAFRFGPQISNVLELDVVTGKGDLVTCSAENNSEAFFAVLGGLGQFGVITRARISLAPAPTRVKWIHLLYNDFSAFSRDQEHLISFTTADYVEGMLLLNQPPLDLSFYPVPDQPRITSLVTQYGITYILELVKYYDNNSQSRINEDVANLVKGLKFVPTFMFEKDVSYEEFLNRVHGEELVLRSKGLWDVPHPWLNLFVPRSRILDFNEGVFKGIILKQNITTGIALVYPMNRNKWDDSMSADTPDEDVFYAVSLLHAASSFDLVKKFEAQNQQILKFCKDTGINIKEYLTGNKTHQEWVEHFGPKWKLFEDRKDEFDPKRILSPGQEIFP
ncbi:cytokinin dehydrogenase 3-like [Gastrolobium bilobum]|uniref:cytokinin dehydrogenase 3-like n=1 Tax=Gastrolobium bilobum TaxID=150636 RepID=UPI002AB242B1|nr:cytokinin dehydrogenase 3-like [Gastrolobium bilobum]